MMTTHVRRRGSGRTRGTVALVRLGVALALPLIVTPALAADATSPSETPCSISQVTDTTTQFPVLATTFQFPSVSATGARLVFRGTPRVSGVPTEGGLFLFDVPTNALTQLTTGDPPHPFNISLGISDDGNRIAFASTLNLAGENADLNSEIFLLDVTSGTFTQITRTTTGIGGGGISPTMNGDGTRIAFSSFEDHTGENSDENQEVFLFDTTTGQFTQVTRTPPGRNSQGPSMSGSGTRIVFGSSGNLTGENPDLNVEVFLFDSTTGAFTQITHTIGIPGFEAQVISANGTRISFSGTADLTGDNPDGNQEAFVFDTTTGTVAQVTHTTGFTLPGQQLSLDATGRLLTLTSNADLTGENPDRNLEVFLLDTTTGAVTQITRTTGPIERANGGAEISDTGTRIAFRSDHDLTGSNGDHTLEIFLATCGLANELVSLAGLPATFQTSADTSGCPARGVGKFSFVARLTSLPESPTLTDLQVQVQTLTNGNLLQNADGGPGGLGATLTVERAGGYADGVLDSGETVEIPFVICLQNRTPFQFFVDVKGSR
jgi:Tol biopolymer transport system component